MGKFDKQYFIKKFTAIPASAIGTGQIEAHCALWHCGLRPITTRNGFAGYKGNPSEAKALAALLAPFDYERGQRHEYSPITCVNDGVGKIKGTNARQRLLIALKSLPS